MLVYKSLDTQQNITTAVSLLTKRKRYGPGIVIYRQDQLRGKNEVGYQHECRADPSADPEGVHEGQPYTSVDPDTSSIPSRLVLLLSYLSVSKWDFKLIYL